MGLLDNLYKENYKYIRALDALDMLAKYERCDVSKIAEFLLAYEYHKCSETYKKNYINQIEPCDDKAVGFVSVDYWAVTKDILDKALENFIYSGNTFSEMYEESDYALYFWLKEDFYNFDGFKKVNFEINDDTYEKYLTYKKLDEYENKANIEQKNKPTELNYTFYLFKKPLLSIHEAACIISGDEPNTVSRCENDTSFDQNFNDYLHAFNLIESAVMAETLAKDELQFYGIKNSDFKKYLSLEGITIDGFNDNLPIENATCFGQPSIQQTEPNTEKLNAEITRLKQLLSAKDVEINGLTNTINELDVKYSEMQKYASNLHEENLYLMGKDANSDDTIRGLNNSALWLESEKVELEIENKGLKTKIKELEAGQPKSIDLDVELSPEQEIPNSRRRNNILKIISILSEMAGLPPEPFTAFNMMEAHATKNSKEIPKKDTTTDWLKKARDSN